MRDIRAGEAARRAAEATFQRKLKPLGPSLPRLVDRRPPPAKRLDADFYRNVWKATGLPGKPPPVYQGGMTSWGNMGEQPIYNRQVHLDPHVADQLRMYGIPGSRRNLSALEVLVHEYTHTAQPRAQKRSVAEGGAEAWTKQNLPRILDALGGGRATDFPAGFAAYKQWTNRMQRRPVYRDYGQFGRRS